LDVIAGQLNLQGGADLRTVFSGSLIGESWSGIDPRIHCTLGNGGGTVAVLQAVHFPPMYSVVCICNSVLSFVVYATLSCDW